MGLAGASIGGRGALPLEQGVGLPASDAHEINPQVTLGEPLVGEGVPELVRVQPPGDPPGRRAAKRLCNTL